MGHRLVRRDLSAAGQKGGTSLVIRGEEGTGKTKVGEMIGSLFGKHYLPISEERYIRRGRQRRGRRSTMHCRPCAQGMSRLWRKPSPRSTDCPKRCDAPPRDQPSKRARTRGRKRRLAAQSA